MKFRRQQKPLRPYEKRLQLVQVVREADNYLILLRDPWQYYSVTVPVDQFPTD